MEKVKIDNLTMDIPIIQGGMGVGISLSNLAGNVAKCGGMGVISAAHPGYKETDFNTNPLDANIRAIKKEISKAKEIANGSGIVAVNIMCAMQDYDELVKASIEGKTDAIISGAGLPLHLPKLTTGTNVKIAPIVSSGKAAQLIIRSWQRKYQRTPDFIVIEGYKAGGHLGFHKDDLINNTCQSLEDILKDVLEVLKKYEINIPVFVAGGIYTHDDIEHFIKLGASGVQIGTRFIGTNECDASPKFKQAFINATSSNIELVTSPVGMPGRAIHTKFLDLVSNHQTKITKCYKCISSCDPKTAPYCITKALIEAVKGNIDEGLVFSGTNGYKIKSIVSVQDLINELMEGK
ncbi:MAG: nitronate monooxygenase family protein [Thomasclavelia sp.]|jgi:nitronate monooxygenase|nr:nitronate monooxygenase family protein [Thomasclavelia sp.]